LIFAGDITNQDECKTGNEYGCSDYGYTTPIDKETIIGIVGGIFGLIVFIIIPIIIVCCYRKSKGVNKKWDEFNLRETLNTAADIHSSSASLSKSKRDPWTSQSSRTPYSDYKKSRSRYSDGDGSVFSDGKFSSHALDPCFPFPNVLGYVPVNFSHQCPKDTLFDFFNTCILLSLYLNVKG